MTNIVILGVGGHGRETLEVIEAINEHASRFSIVGFLDDRVELRGTTIHGLPVVGDRSWLLQSSAHGTSIALGLGSPRARRIAANWALEHGIEVPTLIHPSARVSTRATIGNGVMLMSGSRVSIDVTMGAFTHLNHACSVSHDCTLGAFSTLAPGVLLAGTVTLEEGAEFGVGAQAIPGVRVGAWAMVGAGAVVTRDIPANAVAAGVPATTRRRREAGWHLL